VIGPHHDGSELYVDRAGDAAELRLRTPMRAASRVFLRYLKDGEPRMVEAASATSHEGEVWWRAELPLRNPLISYRWLLIGGDGGYRWLNARGVHDREVPPVDDFRLLAQPSAPAWHLASVGYEVFLDRFAAGAGAQSPPWAVRRAWGETPDAQSADTNRELFGGDLDGLREHLDHIVAVGADTLWLTPFFEAPSNHRYDPATFDHVDPVLGGDAAFEALVGAARERGLRLIGDLSLDHCGATHPWFDRALADVDSDERSFFLFDDAETLGYSAWLGTRFMPRFDWRSPELRRRIGDAMQLWQARGVDGWRIGAATMIGRHREHDLNAAVAVWAREQAGDGVLVAEYWNDFQPDLDGHGWHGVMNYAGFTRPVWWWLRDTGRGRQTYDVFSGAPAPRYGGAEAVAVMDAFRVGLPWETALHSWLCVDTHDTPRFRNVSGSRARQLLGVGLQMTMPGVPMIFAGDELGLEGASGLDARRTMPWDERDAWDTRLLDDYRRLAQLRRSSDALARGGIRFVHASDDAVAYLRETRTERILCLASRAPHTPIPVPSPELSVLYGDEPQAGFLPSDGPAFHVWKFG
jgi:alpha-glucosidase